MKRTADINKNLKPLKDTPYQAYLSNAFRLPTFLTEVNEFPFGLHKYSDNELRSNRQSVQRLVSRRLVPRIEHLCQLQ